MFTNWKFCVLSWWQQPLYILLYICIKVAANKCPGCNDLVYFHMIQDSHVELELSELFAENKHCWPVVEAEEVNRSLTQLFCKKNLQILTVAFQNWTRPKIGLKWCASCAISRSLRLNRISSLKVVMGSKKVHLDLKNSFGVSKNVLRSQKILWDLKKCFQISNNALGSQKNIV